MFSSLASFLFGSSTTSESNNYTELEKEEHEYLPNNIQSKAHCDKDLTTNEKAKSASEATKKITENEFQQGRGKFKRNSRNNKKQLVRVLEHGKKSPDEEFDLNDNDWFFVQEEDLDTTNLHPLADLEEVSDLDANCIRASTPVLEDPNNPRLKVKTSKPQKIKRDSQQTRNCNKQKRNRNSKTGNINTRSYSTTSCNKVYNSSLSPSRSFPGEWGANGAVELRALADVENTQSLYIVSGKQESGHNVSGVSCDSNSSGAKLFTMVDSWYLTPPPCFTSKGPFHMEISPLENLLIEHPSISVYHSIRSSQNAIESFVNFDIENNESKGVEVIHKNGKNKNDKENLGPQKSSKRKSFTIKAYTTSVDQSTHITVEGRASGPRIDRYTASELKMQLFAWNGQKSEEKLNNQNLRRGAMLRSNKARDMQSKGNRQRRADMQNCRLNSGVNNNRKCCY